MKSTRILPLFIALIITACESPLGGLEQTSDQFCSGIASTESLDSCSTLNPNIDVVTWDFANAADYSFESDQITVEAGAAALAPVDMKHSGDDFSRGEYWQTLTSDQKLALDGGNHSQALAADWTPHYQHLIGYWPLDDSWDDASGKNNHASVSVAAGINPIFTVARKIGSKAALFDGNMDTAETSVQTIDFSEGFSVGGWINRTAADVHQSAIRKRGTYMDFELTVNASNKYFCRFINASTQVSVTSSGVAESGVWKHFFCVFDPIKEQLTLYVDGSPIASTQTNGQLPPSESSKISLGQGTWGGSLDEMAVWQTALGPADVGLIYHLQKQKFGGFYLSEVIDSGNTAQVWSKIQTTTTSPYLKEMTSAPEENSLDSLAEGIIGLWHLNESSADGYAGGADFGDDSGFENHLVSSGGGIVLNQDSLFHVGAKFTGTSFVKLGQSSSFIPADRSGFTVSLWVKPSDVSQDRRIFTLPYTSTATALGIAIGRTSQHFSVLARSQATALLEQAGATVAKAQEYYHVVLTVTEGTATLYLNGKTEVVVNSVGLNHSLAESTAFDTKFGVDPSGAARFYTGLMDEIVMWKKALTQAEVEALYLRGANRTRYQVRSCVDSGCECSGYSTSPAGSANDCDGDGIANDSDRSDSYRSEWVGPGGDGSTFYSELFNRADSELNFACHLNLDDQASSICTKREITLSENPNAESANFAFSEMATSARPANKRYFRYRILLEADDNALCSAAPCLPTLTEIQVNEGSTYYGGGLVTALKGFDYSDLDKISFTDEGDCTVTYQLSPNGTDYYYWNLGRWKKTDSTTVSQFNSGAIMSENVGSFAEAVGAGKLYFRAYLKNTSGQACSLKEIEVSREL